MIQKAKNFVRRFMAKLGISPKVYGPFLAGLLAVGILWIQTGHFDTEQLKLLALTFGYGIIGYAVPHKAATVIESGQDHPLALGPDSRVQGTEPPATERGPLAPPEPPPEPGPPPAS